MTDLKRLKQLRKAQNVTLTKMAEDLGENRFTLGRIEGGKANPSFYLVERIVNYLGYELPIIKRL